MTVTHATAARNVAADAVVDLLDVGAGTNGTLVIQTGASAEVSTHDLNDPAFGAASSGTATANAIADDTNATGGTAAQFELRDKDGTAVILGSVGSTGSGEDLEMDSVNIGAGVTVEVTSLTYTAPV